MAIFIDTKSVQKAVTDSCHFVPCEIDFNGEAKVEDFFCKTITPSATDGDDMTAFFRGRPLNGSEITLPDGYTGLVLREPHKRSTEDEDRTLTATHKFNNFTYWNLDKQTTPDDLIQKALQWVDISSALHKPVSLESSPESSQGSVKGQ
ncbi:unnamed protein product [Candidula unifasciata]|uniref:Uncharacterized protein n=1 Tax=Candidula unifasciata TaxID=100452 RepID=A0A8S3Z9F6_9EUPU|nr:unnamed protein product [Candidula unifasciata]